MGEGSVRHDRTTVVTVVTPVGPNWTGLWGIRSVRQTTEEVSLPEGCGTKQTVVTLDV